MRRHTARARIGAAVVLLAAVALTVSACSNDSAALPGGDESMGSTSANSPGQQNIDPLFANAPVADDSLITEGSTMAEIKERGVLIVGEALDAPLLSQQNPLNPEKVNGFDADMAKLLATYILGEPNVKIVPPSSQTREALLKNGTVDVVFNTYTITEKRAEQVSFAGPYFSSGLAIAVRSETNNIDGPEDLNGKTVIVGANTPAVTQVPKIAPDAEIISFASDQTAVKALLQGRGDAYVQDYILLASDAANTEGLKVVTQPFTTEPYGIGIQKGDTEFKQFINDWLRKIQASGEWAKAWERTLGTVTDTEAPTPPEIGSVPGS